MILLREKSKLALVSRIHYICDTFSLPTKNGPIETIFESFADAVSAIKLEPELRITLCYLAILSRYPSETELHLHSENADAPGILELARILLKGDEFLKLNLLNIDYTFQTIPPKTLLIDITHTSNHSQNTGIQRVVRMVCRNLETQLSDYAFIRIAENGRVHFISEPEYQRFHNYWTITSSMKRPLWGEVKAFVFLRKTWVIIYKYLSIAQKLSSLYSRLRLLLRACADLIPKRTFPVEELPFIWVENHFFEPELTGEETRLSVLLTLWRYVLKNSSIIVYDLIPLTHPHLCAKPAVSEAYVHYLSVIRYAKRISCISHNVTENLRNCFKFLQTNQMREPEIRTHYLGYDIAEQNRALDKVSLQTEIARIIPEWDRACPIVFCLGTIEPRKNQLRIIRAALRVMQDGGKFHLVFGGQPGWLSDQFMIELEQAQIGGYSISLIKNLDDITICNLFEASRFSVFCSMVEGFGLPIVESIKAGTPCLISNSGAIREVGEAIGGCVLVDPFSVEDIARGMQKLLTDDKLLGKKISEVRSAKWPTWKDYAKHLRQFIQK